VPHLKDASFEPRSGARKKPTASAVGQDAMDGEPREGRQKLEVLSPLRGSRPATASPTAGAVGYFLALLRS